MKNIGTKLIVAAISLISLTSIAAAGAAVAPTQLPEPGTFGMFAGAIAVALIIAKVVKR